MYQWWGLGDAATTVIQSGASTAAPLLAATGVSASAGAALGISKAVAVPVVGAAIAGIALLATYLIENSGCGVTCVETSSWANQAATLLGQNIAAYFALPTPRSQSSQAAALATFDQVWAQLEANCSQTGTGTAGQKCISDRQAGACTWKQTAAAVPSWGTPAAGECWNWFNGYRDPIANDPDVADDATATATNPSAYTASDVSSALSSLTGGSSTLELLLLAGAAFLVYQMVK
jgi:hypothetical protein